MRITERYYLANGPKSNSLYEWLFYFYFLKLLYEIIYVVNKKILLTKVYVF